MSREKLDATQADERPAHLPADCDMDCEKCEWVELAYASPEKPPAQCNIIEGVSALIAELRARAELGDPYIANKPGLAGLVDEAAECLAAMQHDTATIQRLRDEIEANRPKVEAWDMIATIRTLFQ